MLYLIDFFTKLIFKFLNNYYETHATSPPKLRMVEWAISKTVNDEQHNKYGLCKSLKLS